MIVTTLDLDLDLATGGGALGLGFPDAGDNGSVFK
jgi:hypothetical protein